VSEQTANPAALFPHDPAWLDAAADHLRPIREALADLPGAHRASYDHIGSTSVPGLAAKPYLDLQVRMLPLAAEEELIARLRPLGFERARGSRPDSPGVHRDIPRGDEEVPDEVWEKLIFVHEAGVILHIRRSDSPWGRYTVWFRDWLRADPSARGRYEAMKREESSRNAGKADYDDYTRAKTSFFDEVQAEFTAWARAEGRH
jgi:dephospho-CoA kinase